MSRSPPLSSPSHATLTTSPTLQSVTAVVNIAEPLSSIFLCLAYLCYLSSIAPTTALLSLPNASDSPSSEPRPPPSLLRHLFFAIGFVAFLVISLLYKETAITLVAIVIGTSALVLVAHCLSLTPTFATSVSFFLLHGSWIGLSLASFLFYFLFRKLLVASPEDLSVLCPFLPPSASWLLSNSCPHTAIASPLSLASSSSSLILLCRDTIAMLVSLFSTPLSTALSLVPSLVTNSSSPSPPPPVSAYSSFGELRTHSPS
jgi:hypothetical protein